MEPDLEQFPELNGLEPRPPEDGNKNPFANKAKNLVRLVAAGFFLIGVLDLLAIWFQSEKEHISVSVGRVLISCIPLAIGVLLLVKTSALAQRIEDWLEQ